MTKVPTYGIIASVFQSAKLKLQVQIALLALVGLLYLVTLQNDVCSHPSPYVIDSGEYQIALALWGTVHHTGAPAYSLLGAAFVALLRLVGVAPAAGAALFSVACALAALAFVYMLALDLTDNSLAAGAAVLVLAVGRSFWINSIVAEIYAFGLALSAASLALAVRYSRSGSEGYLYGLAFVWGQAVVHHRLAVFMAPALVVLVAPEFFKSPSIWRILRRAGVSLGLGLLAFAFYLYMPLRARMGAWTYGDPGSWPGFWFIFWAREVPFLLEPPPDLAAWLGNVWASLAVLAGEWSWPGLLAAGVGGGLTLSRQVTRQVGWALLALIVSFLGFVSTFHEAVSPEEVLLWVSLGLALALAVLAAKLWQVRAVLGAGGLAGLLVLALVLGLSNYPAVVELTRDTRGRELIQHLETTMPRGGPVEPTFMALWGGDYFAAAYGRRVSGELDGFEVVDHRAYFKAILDSGSRLITQPATFHELPKSWWRQQLGGVYLTSAGLGLVEIGDSPPLKSVDPAATRPGAAGELGDGIRLLAYQIETLPERALHVTLYWQAVTTPTQRYSVMVHLYDQDQVSSPDNLIAQADSESPVYGWYPTIKWNPGEIVREDYRLVAPAGKTPRLLGVGMYRRDAEGAFHNLGVVYIPLAED